MGERARVKEGHSGGHLYNKPTHRTLINSQSQSPHNNLLLSPRPSTGALEVTLTAHEFGEQIQPVTRIDSKNVLHRY